MLSLRRKDLRGKQSERGVALIMALLVLLVVSAVAAGMLVMSNLETNMSSNFRDEQVSFFAARAGVEETRDRLRSGASNSLNANIPTALPGNANGVLYVTNAAQGEVVAPWNTSGSNYPDTEICKEVTCTNGVPGSAGWYSSATASPSYAANPKLPWKWARVTVKTNNVAAGSNIFSVDGASNGNRICWNGGNELVTTAADCSLDSPVYLITALGLTPSGSRRIVQYEEVLNVNIPIVAALYAKNTVDTGQALNITGNTEPVCSLPSTPGAVSDTSTVTIPGGGNVSGSPTPTVNRYQHRLNPNNLIKSLSNLATDITTVPGVTSSGVSPTSYNVPAGPLGVPPTVNPATGPISSIVAPGTPQNYITPDMSGGSSIPANMGTLKIGGPAPVNGQGILLVRGNLTIDVTNGFNYYGLIVATGDIIFTAADGTAVNPQIHGSMIAGGAFKTCNQPNCSSSISNMSGSISLFQNACMVRNLLGPAFYKTAAVRELMY